ncbi:UDP-N-acetylmuramate--L-alanine ligase [[Clostridium] polysaccharolyticum]|uniref:UDP-N-acetylmuramate--L-alanine ligase n=1 Tax=[Clostridium] polysaccharolyticum TaxID=29364 RepID=A0A1I0FQ73_9FIRM|nr:UDP-N-acetylmuramate--L-alanine ligase [[Clostridium] polysaccharolyticum]SET60335.1 UDP-N-acetylmuramate--L-alanine ligase [[Clostridium] polysaccharolyticum]
MYNIDFTKPIHIHFIGIGGISMSGFAELLHSYGFTISGSDMQPSKITNHLQSLGIHIVYGQSETNITKDINLIVYTAAINKDNPEYIASVNSGIPMMDRAEMVGQIMKNYKNAISISGTHGKTTTTSMLSHIFLSGNMDPTISIGGILDIINGNIRVGKSDNFITEACEYTNSFLKFYPTAGIILNIEADHMDFFKDLNDIRHSFHEFAKRIPKDGLLVLNSEISDYKKFVSDIECNVVNYGLNSFDYDYNAQNIQYDVLGRGSYDLYRNETFIDKIQLSVIGEHNVSNSLAAIALSLELNIPLNIVKEGLFQFTGTERRFQKKGEFNGITVIDDYAHHPTEIEATLKSAKNYPHKNLWVIFQPHTYSRTRAFLDNFAGALSLADKVILTDIYAAREKDPGDISSQDIVARLEALGTEVYYFPSFQEIEEFVKEKCTNGDMLITMGAGDVVLIGEHLTSK